MIDIIGFGAEIGRQWRDHHSELLRGYRTTLLVSLASFALAMVVGSLAAILRTSELRLLRVLSGMYVELFRNTPLLVQLTFFFFGLPRLHVPYFGRPDWFLLSPLQASVIGLTLYTGAYTAEALRSGLLAVDAGQSEAARSLGLSYLQTRSYVVFPQALRIAVPLLTSTLSALFRNSALISVIGATDLLQAADNIQQSNFRTFELFTLAGILYLTMTLPLAWTSSLLERRIAMAH